MPTMTEIVKTMAELMDLDSSGLPRMERRSSEHCTAHISEGVERGSHRARSAAAVGAVGIPRYSIRKTQKCLHPFA